MPLVMQGVWTAMVVAWWQIGEKPLSEPMMTKFYDACKMAAILFESQYVNVFSISKRNCSYFSEVEF